MCCPPVASPTIVTAWRTGAGASLEGGPTASKLTAGMKKINNSSLGAKMLSLMAYILDTVEFHLA